MEPRARLRSPCDTSIGSSCAAETAVETSGPIDVDAGAPGDAFSALPLRPCNAASPAIASGVPMLVSQGRCDGFAWLATTMAVSWYYVGAMSVADPDVEYDVGDDPGAHPENKFSDTRGVVSLVGCGGTLFLGGFAVLCVVGLLRTDASGNVGGCGLSGVEGD